MGTQTPRALRRDSRTARHYFPLVTALLLFLTVWGFSDNLLWRIDQPSNRDPKFIVHGSFCLTWMILLFTQASLVRRGSLKLHRRLGRLGVVVATGVAASTAYVFVTVWRPWQEMSLLVQGNRLLLVGFAVLVALAFRDRARPEWHKRYMLLGSFFMLEPVLSRAFDPIEPLLSGFTESQIDAAWWVFFVAVWGLLFLSLSAHDRACAGTVHEATKVGVGLFCAAWLFVLLV